jgi:ParB family chromosome partitioning protein
VSNKTKKTTKGLGKGFDVLVPIGVDILNVTAGNQEKVHKLAVDIVVPKSEQPRRNFDEQALNELADSIRTHGIIQPLIVSQLEQNLYSIIAGERRWRAAKIIGLKEVPAIIRSANEHEQLEISLLENIQREDLNPVEKAVAIIRLRDQFGQNLDIIAKRLGKAHTTVVNIIRLLNLPPHMQQSLQEGKITEGHARSLLSLQNDPKLQKQLYENILANKWSVRRAEQFVVDAKRDKIKTNTKTKTLVTNEKAATDLKKYLGAKNVTVQKSLKGTGKLVISFASEKEYKQILDKILKK